MESVNSLGRLSDVLFNELERLDSLDVSDESAVKMEVSRSKSIQGVAAQVNLAARTILDTAKVRANITGVKNVPKMLDS